MSKIIITIEDKEDGTVSCVAKPNFQEMIQIMQREDRKTGLTAAEGYALFALNEIRMIAKGKKPIHLRLPGIKGKEKP